MAYLEVTQILQKHDLDLTASRAHGLATGMLCVADKTEEGVWLAQLLTENVVLLDDDKIILVALFEQTRKLLNEEENMYRYDLFLPADDEPLQYQLEAVRDWCEGFLWGCGIHNQASKWKDDTMEIMRDIVEFTKLDTHIKQSMDVSESNEHESALMTIQEYLRVSVMLIKAQLTQ